MGQKLDELEKAGASQNEESLNRCKYLCGDAAGIEGKL